MRRLSSTATALTRAGLFSLCLLLCLQGCATNYSGKYRFGNSASEEKREVRQVDSDALRRTSDDFQKPEVNNPQDETKKATAVSIFKGPVPAMLAATYPLWRINALLGATVTILVIATDAETRTYLLDLAFGS